MYDLQNKLEQKVDLCNEAIVFLFLFFLVAKLNLSFGLAPSKHTKVVILFANSFSIVFNVALVFNITFLT